MASTYSRRLSQHMTGRIRETMTNYKRSSKETVSHTVLGEQ